MGAGPDGPMRGLRSLATAEAVPVEALSGPHLEPAANIGVRGAGPVRSSRSARAFSGPRVMDWQPYRAYKREA